LISKNTGTKEESYYLQFVKATDTKITFINDPSEDTLERKGGVKIFLPADSPVDFLLRWEKQVRNQSQPRSRRFCGAIMMSITEELGKQMDDGGVWTGGKGVLVCRVLRGSPAHGGGLAPGDCIVEVNGVQVFSLRDIYKVLEGEGTLDCTVIREGKLRSGVCFEPLEN
jgi:S1-C subfamily serine protease